MGLNITNDELAELRGKMAAQNSPSAPAEPEDGLDDRGARVYGSATPGQYIAPADELDERAGRIFGADTRVYMDGSANLFPDADPSADDWDDRGARVYGS
ncbi:hypothetical protein [Corynebacterium xerosis]|uniref:hypothetical protein n=1 Tax=Corynebacterium xerosis TaxID=1725 RepID=UPI00366BF9B9